MAFLMHSADSVHACLPSQRGSLLPVPDLLPPNPGRGHSFFLLYLAGQDLSLTNPDRLTTDANGCDECEVPTRTHGAAGRGRGREHR